MLKGISISNGVAIGKAYLLDRSRVCVLKHKIPHDEIEPEIKRFREAIEKSKVQIQDIKKRAGKIADKYAVILQTYALLLEDEILVSDTIDNIRRESMNAEWALTETLEKFTRIFDSINDEYLKGKRDDLELVVHRVLRNLLGHQQESLAEISEPVVIISHSLSPSDTLLMAKSPILGMATEVGGKTSHVGIFASALGLPAIVGVKDLMSKINSGDTVIIDAIDGAVIPNPDEAVLQQYRKKQQNYRFYENKLLEGIDLPTETQDGCRIHLMANIESPHEVRSARKLGAQGIGLYRTEFIYLTSNAWPTEQELYTNFRNVIEGMEPYPVVIRTLDIGGDKVLKDANNEPEDNPALGLRGIRMSLAYPERFVVQLKGILRASLFGKAKILYPMVSTVEEVIEANIILETVKNDLRSRQIPFDEDIDVGAMIETPAAALCVDRILKEVDFISIGTNDLIQYTLAVDRTNENVAHLYQPFHPSILRILKEIFAAAETAGKPVAICGELGGDPLATALLLGLGKVDELSMDPHSIPKVKKIIRNLHLKDAREIADQALALTSTREIDQFVVQTMRTRFPSDFDRTQEFEEKTS
jgi:phosphotransferase system enzyme I (PtsI)